MDESADEAAVVATPFPPSETPFDLLALLREIGGVLDDVATSALLINNVATAVT